MPVRKHESKVKRTKRVRPIRGRKIYISTEEAQQIGEAMDVYGARLHDVIKEWSPASRAMFVGRLKRTAGKFDWARPGKAGAR